MVRSVLFLFLFLLVFKANHDPSFLQISMLCRMELGPSLSESESRFSLDDKMRERKGDHYKQDGYMLSL